MLSSTDIIAALKRAARDQSVRDAAVTLALAVAQAVLSPRAARALAERWRDR